MSLADWIRLTMEAAQWPARSDLANSQFEQPTATGQIWFSTQLLSIGNYPSSRKRMSAPQRLKL